MLSDDKPNDVIGFMMLVEMKKCIAISRRCSDSYKKFISELGLFTITTYLVCVKKTLVMPVENVVTMMECNVMMPVYAKFVA